MKQIKGMQLGAVLAAMLLVGIAFVPTVSAQELNGQRIPDRVDKATLDDRTPPIIKELRNKGFKEAQIAQTILNISIKYQEGWTDEDNKRVIGYFQKIKKGLKNNTIQTIGTQYQYFTSHLGAAGNWIEVGVARFYWNPNEYVVYTYDTTQPAGQEWRTWGIANPNIDNNFEIYVHNFNDGQGYPYYMAWNGTVIRTGHVPFATGNPDENHEYFAASDSSFTPVSVAYFKDSYLYRGNTALWWNSYLPETTQSYGLSPVQVSRYIPSGSNAYRIDSWIP